MERLYFWHRSRPLLFQWQPATEQQFFIEFNYKYELLIFFGCGNGRVMKRDE